MTLLYVLYRLDWISLIVMNEFNCPFKVSVFSNNFSVPLTYGKQSPSQQLKSCKSREFHSLKILYRPEQWVDELFLLFSLLSSFSNCVFRISVIWLSQASSWSHPGTFSQRIFQICKPTSVGDWYNYICRYRLGLVSEIPAQSEFCSFLLSFGPFVFWVVPK